MINQRIFRLFLFSLAVGLVLLGINRLADKENQVEVIVPEPVRKVVEQVKSKATSVGQSELVRGVKDKIFSRFQKEKEKIVEEKVQGIVEEIKNLPEEQFEEFKSDLCNEVCGQP